uniref:Uncharacterized protein n=1 Tax=Aegilops tauschii subsp. strangulata TaxID=200361 RepID=A0A452ZX77_AEGTS
MVDYLNHERAFLDCRTKSVPGKRIKFWRVGIGSPAGWLQSLGCCRLAALLLSVSSSHSRGTFDR